MNKIKNFLLGFTTTFKTWFLKNWGQNSIFLGAMRAYTIPTLPARIERYNNNIFVRIFRLIGALCFLFIISKFYLHLPNFLRLLCAVVACIHITQVFIIFLIKTVYSLHTLIYKRDLFFIRNSPLNRYASIVSQALYCIKVGCAASTTGAAFIAGGLAYDALLQEAGRERYFTS